MKITAVERKNAHRWQVDVDGEYWYILDVEIVSEFGIRPGLECDEGFLAQARHAADVRRAREYALYLLERRDYCYAELVHKLGGSVDEEVALRTADRMVELGLVDDEKYAAKLARHLLEFKKYGHYRARMAMREKGLDKDLVEDALAAVEDAPDYDVHDKLTALIEKKYARTLAGERGPQKVATALARMGYHYDDIKAALRAFEEQD